MARGIDRVVYADLFWETLDRVRGHSRYPAIRAQFDDFIASKKDSAIQPMNQRDKRLKGVLSSVSHWAFSRNPDIVLFYVIQDGALMMAMIGDHHDYSFQGRGTRNDERTARRIGNAISKGHVPSPRWKSISWKRPSDLIGHPDLRELSKDALESLTASLRQELDDGRMFERIFGTSILDAEPSVFDAWIDETYAAYDLVTDAMAETPSTPETALARAIDRRSKASLPSM